jgi:hypothetical protein
VTVLLVGSVLAGGDNKDAPKSKRGYSLGYGYDPYYDVVDHAPLASAAVVHHAPITTVHHAPLAAAPIVAAAPAVVAHAPVVAPLAKITSSVVSTNVHHYPSYTPYNSYVASSAPYNSYVASPAPYNSYVASHAPYSPYVASHAPIVASPYYHAPAAVVAPAAYSHSPLYTAFHRR